MIRLIVRLLAIPAIAIAVAGVAAPTATAMPLTLEQELSRGQNSGVYSLKYVALGDSVAAGLGYAPNPGASEEDVACGRSTEAYAHDVAAAITARLAGSGISLETTNAACQGATTKNMLLPQTLGTRIVEPQLDAAFAGRQPALLTVTSGANDVRWANFIAACFSPANCATPENTALIQSYIATAKLDMNTTMRSIQTRSRFIPPLVVATGYYVPISPQCANANLTLDEIAWVTQATTDLNNAIRKATQGSYWFARFAPIDFTGHDICSADSWIQRPGVPGEPAPFHPTPKGQEAMATSILETIGISQ